MNRRGFLSQLPTLAVAVVAAPVTVMASKPERAVSQVQPMCPKCGFFVMFTRRERFVGEDIPVTCSCGWSGVSAKTHEV